jgi:predicted nuclease with TOPRIM domain
MTQEELQRRLEALNAEFDKGQARFHELQQQQSQLHETLLRIDGARHLLMEFLEEGNQNIKNVDVIPESVNARN